MRRTLHWMGVALLLVSGISWVQSGRELYMWTARSGPISESVVTAQPLQFAGHTIEFRDDLSEDSTYSEEAFEGVLEVWVDGERLGRPSRALVRPGREYDDLGRYHLWADAWDFTDRRTEERSLWITRRLQPTDDEPRRFEVIAVSEDGTIRARTLTARGLSESWMTFRSTQFLRSNSWSVYPFSMLEALYFWPLFLLFPVGTTVMGVTLVRRARPRQEVD